MTPEGWKYYNHAFIPATAPHITPDTSVFSSNNIWKQNKNALLAQWTENFDCGYDTGWYYVIKYGPFIPEELSSKVRKHIRQSQKKVVVKQINPAEYAKELCETHNAAGERYGDFKGWATEKDFEASNGKYDYFGAFSVEGNNLIGYMMCRRSDNHVDTVTSKYHPEYLNLRASDALHYAVLDYYLNSEGYEYVCSGSRNINHKTNVQNYKIDNFMFRKVYCKLCIKYNPKIKWLIKLLYPFRNIINKFDRINIVHKINGIMKMEEIIREQNNG